MTSSITSNRAVENAAIMFVIAHEAACGRTAHDTRGTGAAGDVASDGRVIEMWDGGPQPFQQQ